MIFGLSTIRLAIAAAALAAIVLGFMVYRQSLINDGWDRALRKVETQNEQAREAARKAQRGVDACYDAGGMWSTITGECSR